MDQPQLFPHPRFDFLQDILMFLEKGLGIVPALAEALALEGIPGATLFENAVFRRKIENISFSGNSFAENDVKFRFPEGGLLYS